MNPTAVIADDEPIMCESLLDCLTLLWPELDVIGQAQDGPSALSLIEAHRPSFAFLDIRMPGLTGLQVARSMPSTTHVVFVTAFDSHAVEAFEANAVDYVVKPLELERMAKVVAKLKRMNAQASVADMDALIAALQSKGISSADGKKQVQTTLPAKLQWLRVGKGTQVHLVNAQDVHFFESDEKYTRVVAENVDGLIRTSLKELTEMLGSEDFIQTSRSTLVNRRYIFAVHRKGEVVEIEMKINKTRLKVSTAHHHLFRAM